MDGLVGGKRNKGGHAISTPSNSLNDGYKKRAFFITVV